MPPKTCLFLSLLFLLPPPAFAQCQVKDQLCASLEEILDAASIDFRGYLSHTLPLPQVSTDSTKVPCSTSTWANNVPMFICYAQVPLNSATVWYTRVMDYLKPLAPSWNFTVKAPGENRYVDAGPANCEPTPTEGPYIGQCPLHLELAKQADSSAKIYLVVNSISSPYLLRHTLLSPTPAKSPQSAPLGVNLGGSAGCDEFCQALKKAFEARATGFAGAPPSKLPGAKDCLIKKGPGDLDVRFVCYWQEVSASAAETRFRDLVARLQILVPSDWSSHQDMEPDEQTGAPLTAWFTGEPSRGNEIHVYAAGDSVGLHITSPK